MLAWDLGDFEYIETFTERDYNGEKVRVRVYTTKGLKESKNIALDATLKVIDSFSDF